jgi:hypothetical protein
VEGGLDSISALRLQAMTKSKFNVTIPIEVILHPNTNVNTLLDYVTPNSTTPSTTLRSVDDSQKINWKEELQLPESLVACLKNSRTVNVESEKKETTNIFLTGATGLLGMFL